MTRLAAVCLALLIGVPGACFAKGGGHGGGGHGSSSHASHSSSHSSSRAPSHHSQSSSSHAGDHRKAQDVARDSHGKIARSEKAKDSFKKTHPCPSTGRSSGACPGYVVDHVKPLKRGGEDAPGNMQWQTAAQAKAKDKWE